MTALHPALRRPAILLGLGGLCSALLALLPGEAGPLAARAGLAVLAVGALGALAARRGRPLPAASLRVTARAALGRAALAVVEVDGRRFLVGGGDRHLELLAELEPILAPPPEGAP